MGAFFEPKALWGSTSVRAAADCGGGRGEASFATTTGAGMIGISDGAGVSAVSDGACANAGAVGDAGSGDLRKEGRNRANKPSKPTLRIPARMRRRFTRSSEIIRAICPYGSRNRILPRNRGNVRVVVAELHLNTKRSIATETLPCWLRSRWEALCGGIVVNHNCYPPPPFFISVDSKGTLSCFR